MTGPRPYAGVVLSLLIAASPGPLLADAHDADDAPVQAQAADAPAAPATLTDEAERPLGPGTSRTAGRVVNRERDPLSLRVWTDALYTRQIVPEDAELGRPDDGLTAGLRVVGDYNRRGRRDGVYARVDGAFKHRLLGSEPSFTGRPFRSGWDDRPYRLSDAFVGYRSGTYAAQLGRSVLHQVGYQVVDGFVGRYQSRGFSGTLFGGLSPELYTLAFDPLSVPAGAGGGWIGSNGGLDLGAALVFSEGQADRFTLTQRGHLRPGPDGLAFHALAVLDAATATGFHARMLTVSADYAPATRSRVGLTLSHFGAPLPAVTYARHSPLEDQLFAGEIHDADYISNRAFLASVSRTNLRLHGVLGLTDGVVLYGLANLQRRAEPKLADTAFLALDVAPEDPGLIGGIDNAAGATVGARSFQRHAGISVDASYSYLLGFISYNQLANLQADYTLPGGRYAISLGGSRIHSLHQQGVADGTGRPESVGPHVYWQASGQIFARPIQSVSVSLLYRALIGEAPQVDEDAPLPNPFLMGPHHTGYLRVEYRY
jgi:hypothetical protein